MIVRTLRLGECFERIGRERVRPEVAVVTGGVRVARKDVAELRRPVAHHDLARHAERGERLLLECVGVDVASAREVEFHVDERAGQVFDRGETLVEGGRLVDLGDELLGNRFASLVVECEPIQHLGRLHPVLEKLRGKLDVVARDVGSRERGVVDVRREAVERVSEFVEQRARVVPADEHRFAGLALHEVRVVRDDRRDVAAEPALVPVLVHPRARFFAWTRIGIEIPEPDVPAARLVFHFPDAHVGLVHLDVIDRRERETEELAGDPEHGLAQFLETEVRLHVVLIESVLRLADFLGVIPIVPRRDRALLAFFVRDGLHIGDLLANARHRRSPHRLHEGHRLLGRLRHAVFDAPVRVRLVSEELGAFGAELQDLGDDLTVVVGVAVVAAAHEVVPDFFAQVVAVRIREEGVYRRACVGDRPLALLPARLGCRGGARAHRVGKAREIFLVLKDKRVVLLIGEDVLAEVRVKKCEALVQFGHALLRRGVELRAGAHEARVVAPGEPLLLGRELRFVGRIVNRFDAGEELRVLGDLVVERGEDRLHLALESLKLGTAHRARPHTVDGRDVVERGA